MTQPNTDQEHPLIGFLITHQEDRAMLAALRRGLGVEPGGVPDMFPYVVRFVSEKRGLWHERCVYMVASLFALHPLVGQQGNLGGHLRKLADEVGDDQSTERRFANLMRAEPDMLPDLLRQMISLLKSKDIPVNWQMLMRDVLTWNSSDARRWTTRRWASEFWTE